jgi:uncharacterized protein YcfJ
MKTLSVAFVAVLSMGCIDNASAAITLYEHDGFRGRAITLGSTVYNLKSNGFNDMASSALVDGGTWLVCDDENFGGKCVVLSPGSYGSLSELGMQDNVTSIRPHRGNSNRPQTYEMAVPQGAPNYGYYRRPNEPVYTARVIEARAVVGAGEQRCWVERQQVGGAGEANVGAAVVGAIIGGVLGHQVGGGRGQDAATAAGALAGASIGARRNGGSLPYTRDVRRCENYGNSQPTYWDVTYSYGGTYHHIQMSYPPGDTIQVNRLGEPRQ